MKKIIFRIFGALASAMIIVSVFVPFVSVNGNSASLWESFSITNSLYLPIMIIIFGVIGVIFFSLNVKTEFAYMSTGAISFFVVMRTIDIINQGAFNKLSYGYYFLAIGAILTGIMAFLTNLKTKVREEKTISVQQNGEPSMLDQIDKLYNNQEINQNQLSSIQVVNNNIDPLPIQPVENLELNQQLIKSKEEPIQDFSQVTIPMREPLNQEESLSVKPVLQEFSKMDENQLSSVQSINNKVDPLPIQPIENIELNHLQAFSETKGYQAQEISQTSVPKPESLKQENSVQANPVVSQFTQSYEQRPINQYTNLQQSPIIEQSVIRPVQPLENTTQEVTHNPVVQEFNNSVNTENAQNNDSNALDIFEQLLNK